MQMLTVAFDIWILLLEIISWKETSIFTLMEEGNLKSFCPRAPVPPTRKRPAKGYEMFGFQKNLHKYYLLFGCPRVGL